MRMFARICFSAFIALSGNAFAEQRQYGDVVLNGTLFETSLIYEPTADVMVCNVNGPDGFLSIRSGPGTNFTIERKLNRLATLRVLPTQAVGNWIPVATAHRNFSKDGIRQTTSKSLHIEGWAHANYLCKFSIYGSSQGAYVAPTVSMSNTHISYSRNDFLMISAVIEHLSASTKADENTKSRITSLSSHLEVIKYQLQKEGIDPNALTRLDNADMFSASFNFPKTSYFRASGNDYGKIWLKPAVSQVGDLQFTLNFLGDQKGYHEEWKMTTDELAVMSVGLSKSLAWTLKANKENVRKAFQKRSACVGSENCDSRQQGTSSLETVFRIKDTGEPVTDIVLNKGTFSTAYTLEPEGVLLLTAYIDFIADVATSEFFSNTATDEVLSEIFN